MPGLFAAGEAACTGVHGANRLASNSLLEGLVFGARAAQAMTEPPQAAATKRDRVAVGDPGLPVSSLAATGNPGRSPQAPAVSPRRLSAADVRALMWRDAGLFRDRTGLTRAVAALDAAAAADYAPTADGTRDRNLITVARLIAGAALRREESRGGHFRADFPERDDTRWKVHCVDVKDTEGTKDPEAQRHRGTEA